MDRIDAILRQFGKLEHLISGEDASRSPLPALGSAPQDARYDAFAASRALSSSEGQTPGALVPKWGSAIVMEHRMSVAPDIVGAEITADVFWRIVGSVVLAST
jgi:hypothetical protein